MRFISILLNTYVHLKKVNIYIYEKPASPVTIFCKNTDSEHSQNYLFPTMRAAFWEEKILECCFHHHIKINKYIYIYATRPLCDLLELLQAQTYMTHTHTYI